MQQLIDDSIDPLVGIQTLAKIRQRIRTDLPPETFSPTPWRAWLCVPLNAVVVACIAYTARVHPPWYILAGLAIVLGQVYATLGFWVHDVMHGSVVRSRRLQDAISFLGLYPFLLSPITWRVWHVQAHHGNTQSARDPDATVNVEEYRRTPIARLYLTFAPSSRNPLGVFLFYPFWFTLHGQEILWLSHLHADWDIASYRFDRKIAVPQTLAVFAFWIGVCACVGLFDSVFIVWIPMMLGNMVLLAFISTQHAFLPRSSGTRDGHPLENTVSVRVPWIVEKLNLNFNHHVEHHLFPSMNYSKLPQVRAWLRQHFRDEYLQPTLLEAIRAFVTTPRIYADRSHLCYPESQPESLVDTLALRRRLISGDGR
jgi:fatty acid desaturase